jgi:hypothetical protein
MKKIFVMICALLLLAGLQAFAQEKDANTEPVVFIDFANLADTDIDFSDTAGAQVSDVDKKNLKVNLSLENWETDLASSSQVGDNMALTYVSAATTKGGQTVLGIRVHYPEASYNSYCIIKPPFDIPAYEDKAGDKSGTGNKFTGKGILKNVGTIKFIQMDVNGRNFPHGIGLVIEDQTNQERIIFIDYLRFSGWKTLTWKNPTYITDVKNRELASKPLYPQSQPYIKFKGIVIYRDGSNIGGDFVTYIKNVKVAYDLALTTDSELDVDDEAVWHIVRDREERRKMAELKRLGNVQILRYLEKKKMYKGPDPDKPAQSEGK